MGKAADMMFQISKIRLVAVVAIMVMAAFQTAVAEEFITVIWADVAVDETGHVTDVDVIAGLPDPILNVIAEKVSNWEFEPAQQKGKAVPSTTAVFTSVTFAEHENGDISITVDQVRSGPRPVINPPPEYPEALRGDNIKGSVELQYTVMADGSVSDVKVVESKPQGVFDDIAVKAVQGWSFKPRTVNSIPINSLVRQIIEFNP